ncbi:MAG TPA: hypothetical protein VG432_15010 [Gemmatimonadaceae bacterium]|nr:hypothetical protein [Gemmatimonadaceae bacterium]
MTKISMRRGAASVGDVARLPSPAATITQPAVVFATNTRGPNVRPRPSGMQPLTCRA